MVLKVCGRKHGNIDAVSEDKEEVQGLCLALPALRDKRLRTNQLADCRPAVGGMQNGDQRVVLEAQ